MEPGKIAYQESGIVRSENQEASLELS